MSQFLVDKTSNGDNKLFEILQNDLRKLSAEAKKKFPMIKEVMFLLLIICHFFPENLKSRL